jgi:MFS-type transporter involved in bile tolerance (Atg22 family)
MGQNSDPSQKNRSQYVFNMTLAAVAGQVGCLTLVIVLAALFGGLYLDSRFDSRPVITITLMILSVPVTLFLMLWVVRKATSRLQNASKPQITETQEEDHNSGYKES